MIAVLFVPAGVAAEGIDSIMLRDPQLPRAKAVQAFSPALKDVWLELLARPESEYKVRAAGAIADAHRRGMRGLEKTVPNLVTELDKKDLPSAVRVALVQALSTLDAKEAAPSMFQAGKDGDIDVRQIVDPCLTRWLYEPARASWLDRLKVRPSQRGTILAIRGLLAAKDTRAIPSLLAIAADSEELPPVRIEAAGALAVLRPAGSEADAKSLASDMTGRGVIARVVAVTLLRKHESAEAIAQLQSFVGDPEPTVASRAMARLVELDTKHVAPVLDAALANPDAAVRLLAVEALLRDPTDRNLIKLGDRLADIHPDVRIKARHSFVKLFEKPELKDPIRREGTRILGGAYWGGLQQAAHLLGQIDHKPSVDRLLALLDHERHEVFVTAAWSLRVLDVARMTDRVLPVFERRLKVIKASTFQLPPLVALGYEEQLSQLAQFFGQQKYRGASPILSSLVPRGSGPMETRAAAIWALGKIHEGEKNLGFEAALESRLNAVTPADLEPLLIRRMCATTLGRLKVAGSVKSLRLYYSGKPAIEDVSNACGWAIEQITGEKVPPPGIEEEFLINFFAVPLGK